MGYSYAVRNTVLMEPKWNVKYYIYEGASEGVSINGTKVECKGCSAGISKLDQICINGTKVECKDAIALTLAVVTIVLMEPKWNVKATIISDRIPTASVLMEPKWNVKIGAGLSEFVTAEY